MKTKILAFFLASLAILSICACSKQQGEKIDTVNETTASDTTEETTAEEGWHEVNDNLPIGLSYSDKTFTILCRSEEPYVNEFNIFEESPIILNNAVYKRNLTVEDRLGIKIVVDAKIGNYPNASQFTSLIKNNVTAGTKTWDAIAGYAGGTISLSFQGYYYDLTDTDYLDFDKQYWNQSIVDQLNLNDKLYTVSGDMSPMLIGNAIVLFENLELAEKYNIPDIYSLVLNNKWTNDKLLEIVKMVYSDENGNQVYDKEDIYGLTMPQNSQIDAFYAAYDLPITEKNSNGEIVLAWEKDKVISVYDKIYQLLCKTQEVWAKKDYTDDEATDYLTNFVNGKALLTANRLYMVSTYLGNMEYDYAIIPYPKFDENQESYYSHSWDQYSIISIPVDASDPDYSGAVLEAMASASYNIVTPAYYETALKYRYSPNKESSQMLDIIRSNIRIEFCYLMSSTNVIWFLRDQIKTGLNLVSSAYASNRKAYEANLKNALESLNT